tara:strand:- start:438 stop:1205 length:768 start_codon:yes stop_codon:yes gene_type:complete
VSAPLIVSFGGGVNSAAMLVGMQERGIVPDLILFADTGSEKPETYKFVETMRRWTVRNMDRGIITVPHPTGDTLIESCFRNGTLPSKAYGFPGCSVKFKHQPMEKYENSIYGKDTIITKAIGYHAGEDRGSGITEKGRYRYRYFLKEWHWRQRECIEALTRAALPVPLKSSCWFCPSMKPHEIVWLNKKHPELFQIAVQMESAAEPYHAEKGGRTKGLGRNFSWKQVADADEAQMDAFDEPDDVPCMCYDGDPDE